MTLSDRYRIVKLVNGTHSVHSLSEAETFHPVVGPVAEAQELYVQQLRLLERFAATGEEFVIWDIGLGAAANPLTFLNALRDRSLEGSAQPVGRGMVRIVSFDHTLEPLRFALSNAQHLTYLQGYEEPLRRLVDTGDVSFPLTPEVQVAWQVHVADFPALVSQPVAETWPKPHAIMFDAFSPAKNPSMWTLPLFSRIFELLDPKRPCALPTYSRSTILRVTLLLAGFFCGSGTPNREERGDNNCGKRDGTAYRAASIRLARTRKEIHQCGTYA